MPMPIVRFKSANSIPVLYKYVNVVKSAVSELVIGLLCPLP
jgi:hypothetical protein